MSLMEKFADPDMMHSLSFADKMAGAGLTTLMGMEMHLVRQPNNNERGNHR